MNRVELRGLLGNGHAAIVPVLQSSDPELSVRNARTVADAGARGLFLLNHRFDAPDLLPVIEAVRAALPDFWIGVNLRGQPPRLAFPVLAGLAEREVRVDALWTDDGEIAPRAAEQAAAAEITAVREASGWKGLYLAGVALTPERPVPPPDIGFAAKAGAEAADVIVTALSGSANARDLTKLVAIRRAVGEAGLAIGSGINEKTVPVYAARADCLLVARAVCDPDEPSIIDGERIAALMQAAAEVTEVAS